MVARGYSACLDAVKDYFSETSNQFNLLADVLSRDGNAIMSMEWFAQLYEEQLGEIDNEVGTMTEALATRLPLHL